MSMANVPYNDDDFNLDSESYVPTGTTILPQPGNYRVKVTSMKRKQDKNGQVILQEEKYPILVLNRIEITEPAEDNGQFAVFQDVRTKPYARPAGAGRKVAASDAADVLLSIDANGLQGLVDFEDVGRELEQRLASGSEFPVYIGYSGYDKAQAQAALAKIGPNASQEQINEAYNSARLNTKDFRGPDGVARSAVKGPSGNMVEAKLKITTFIPADKNVTFGPTKVGKK